MERSENPKNHRLCGLGIRKPVPIFRAFGLCGVQQHGSFPAVDDGLYSAHHHGTLLLSHLAFSPQHPLFQILCQSDQASFGNHDNPTWLLYGNLQEISFPGFSLLFPDAPFPGYIVRFGRFWMILVAFPGIPCPSCPCYTPVTEARCSASLHGKDLLSRVPDLARPGTGLRREAGCAWETQELTDEHVTVRLVVLPPEGAKLPAAWMR